MSTVTIACRFPAGLKLRVNNDQDVIILNGSAAAEASPTGSTINRGSGGVALTAGIDAALWDAWVAQNPTSSLLTSGTIFENSRT